MASRNDIIHIQFQANAGKANAALNALRAEASRTKSEVERLTQELQRKKAANFPLADIQQLEAELRKAKTEHNQWQSALNNNLKGVRALDEAIKIFNSDLNGGKGSVDGMNAALSKTARNAAELQKNRSDKGSQTWKEMVALIKALDQNILSCNTATNQLVSTIKNGGVVSRATLTQAKTDLQQMLALEKEGTNAWKKYNSQLKVVDEALVKMNVQQQQMAGKNALTQFFRGDYLTKSRSELEQMITKLREYQAVIADPEGKGARHFQATQTAITKLSERLQTLKVDANAVKQALQMAGAAGVANKFGSGLAAQQTKLANAYGQTAAKLAQLKQQRETYTILQQHGITLNAQEQAMLAQLDAQIATTTTQLANEKAAMIQAGDANQLTTQQIQQSIQVLRQQQETVAAGSPAWKKYEAACTTLDERLKIMKGEAMALADALKVAGSAGGKGFTGTAQQLELAEKAIQKAMTTAQKGSAEWKKYQDALAKIRVEMQNTGITSERMQSIINKPTNAKNLNELSAAVKRAKAELDLMAGTIGKNSKAYSQMAEKTRQAEIRLKELQAQSHGTATSFGKAMSRLKTYIGLYVGAAVAMQKIIGTLGDIAELSDKMGEVRKTTGFTADEVGRLVTNLRKLDTRTSLTGLMELSAAAGQLGLKTQQDMLGFTEAANKLMVALPEMGKEGATQMLKVALATGEIAKIQEQMNKGLIDGSSAVAVAMEKVGSTIDQLRANSAAAAPAITDFVKRVGAVGAQSGITIDQVAALGSTVDALGMRVEMSATALSRMIPAIRNNAFDVAKAIGVTPETLRELFDAGRGMEAILLIFQHIKDAGKDADSIEEMLGMGNMKEIMKELNQMGARAGIVFSGLSQNVDELRRQLGVAANAYEENIAIMNEYNKMNETTAAKWERLKNEVEEAFVGDQAQKTLGWIIDNLRTLVDLLTGRVAPALDFIGILLKTLLVRWTLVKLGIGEALLVTLPRAIKTFAATATMAFTTIGTQIKAIGYHLGIVTMQTKRAAVEMRKMNVGTLANFWTALALAIGYAAWKLYEWKQRLDQTANAVAEAEANLSSTTREAGNLFSKYKQLVEKQDGLTRSTKNLKDREEDLKKQLDLIKKAMGDGAEQTAAYKKKQEELEEAHKKVTEAEEEASKATNKRSALISEINSKYSTYLGYMLSEASTAETVASAHDLIIASLKEEMYWREKNKAFQTVTEQHADNLKSYRESSLAELNGIDAMRQQNIMSAWQAQLSSVQYDASKGGYIIPGASEAFESIEKAMDVMKDRFNSVLTTEGGYYMLNPSDKQSRLNDWWGETGAAGWGGWTGWTDRGFKDWTRESLKVLKEASTLQGMAGSAATKAHETAVQQAEANTNALIAQAQQRGEDGKVNNKQLAEAIVGIQKNLSKYGELGARFSQFGGENTLENIGKVLLKDVPEATRKTVMADVQRIAANGINPPAPEKPTNPWGSRLPAESTDYANMNADVLVNRRKQMNNFVRSIQTDSDVQAVLKEDAALKKAIENGMASDMRTVINWYNTERLKIQDELHARYLTNTGDWLDPKQQKARKKRLQDDMKAFLEELDAYYTERKTHIQEAGNEEGLTEAEVRNRTLANEMEWRRRRAELQIMYSAKAKKVTQDEQDSIAAIIAERTGDDIKFIKATIDKTVKFSEAIRDANEQGAKEYRKFQGDLDLGSQRDFNKVETALHQQLKGIQDIIDKERPFNGITKNLRENLVTMGVLTADMTKERDRLMKENADMTDFNARQAAEEVKRTAFMLDEAENAYTSTIEDVMRRMADAGMEAWAEEIRQSPKMQEALMAQLHQTYDSIQEAIKKEASLMKKQAETMWNNILLPGGDGKTTVKDAFEKTIAQLGVDQGRVSRANSLIGAGVQSERVADKLAIKQMQLQLTMQQHYYNLMRKQGRQRIDDLERQVQLAKEDGDLEKAKRIEQDKQHVEMSLRLAMTKEQTELLKQQEEIIARTEESENRLYTQLREWADLLSSSMKEVFEASNAGNAEYYNERAKMNLTGKGGPGAGTYIVIESEGTEDAKAHYEYLDERAALERQHEIEQQNAQVDAWRKVMDDLNQKMSEQITDWMNAALQNASIDLNTTAVDANTNALNSLSEQLSQGINVNTNGNGVPEALKTPEAPAAQEGYGMPWQQTEGQPAEGEWMSPLMPAEAVPAYEDSPWAKYAENRAQATESILDSQKKEMQGQKQTDQQMTKSTQSTFAKMTLAANMYGVAYQAMSNDNLSTTQKFEMMALQAVGNYAIGALTTEMAAASAKAATDSPGVLGTLWKQLGWAAAPVFAIFTGLLGGLMGLASSKIGKAKSQIAQATGSSVGAGRLATGMQTYAEGNVNELTDPGTLTPGRSYNVDGADGRTYRAKYTGKGAKTHITSGPEFHLVGEAGQEAIIDAHTTRNIRLNEPEIWHSIQTLYNGGRLSATRRRGRGVRAFADGNLDDFEEVESMAGDGGGMGGFTPEQAAAFQSSLDRNNELLERALTEGIKGVFNVYGKNGLIDSYDTGKKTVTRHGERY